MMIKAESEDESRLSPQVQSEYVPSAGAVLVDQCAASSTIKSKESQQYIGRAGAQITAEVKS